MEEKKMSPLTAKRESNLELLRIVAMLLIILHHIVIHSFYPQLTDETVMEFFHTGVFNHPKFYSQLLLPEALLPLGKAANGMFLMISGYFLIERGCTVDLRKVSRKLFPQIVFAAILVIVVPFALSLSYPNEREFGTLLGIGVFNEDWWFVGYYFLIVTIGAIFLNRRTWECSRKTYSTLLIVLFVLVTLSFSGFFLEGIAGGLRTVCAGLFCYLWGGYVKKYQPLKNVRVSTLLLIFAVIFVLIGISYYNATQVAINEYLQEIKELKALKIKPEQDFIQVYKAIEYPEYSIVSVSLAVLIFELFRRIRIPSSSVINYLAGASFMIYLIHDNDFVRDYWKYNANLVKILYISPYDFFIKILTYALLTYLLGVALYTVYRGILLLTMKAKILFVRKEKLSPPKPST